jgi:hypothetical protein
MRLVTPGKTSSHRRGRATYSSVAAIIVPIRRGGHPSCWCLCPERRATQDLAWCGICIE